MLRLLPRPFSSTSLRTTCLRALTSSAHLLKKPLPPRPKFDREHEISEAFLCGTGPGGQKINKTSSAVQLIHAPTGIVLKVQATRSRSQNRKIARQMLADKLEFLEKGEQSRVAVVKAVKQRKKNSASKKSRRKYRALEEAKMGVGEGGERERAEEGEGKEVGEKD